MLQNMNILNVIKSSFDVLLICIRYCEVSANDLEDQLVSLISATCLILCLELLEVYLVFEGQYP